MKGRERQLYGEEEIQYSVVKGKKDLDDDSVSCISDPGSPRKTWHRSRHAAI